MLGSISNKIAIVSLLRDKFESLGMCNDVTTHILSLCECDILAIQCVRVLCRKNLNMYDLEQYEKNKKRYRSHPFCNNCYQNWVIVSTRVKRSLHCKPIPSLNNFQLWQHCNNCMPFIIKTRQNGWVYTGGQECCDIARQTIWKITHCDRRPQQKGKKRLYSDDELRRLYNEYVEETC